MTIPKRRTMPRTCHRPSGTGTKGPRSVFPAPPKRKWIAGLQILRGGAGEFDGNLLYKFDEVRMNTRWKRHAERFSGILF